MRGSVRGCAPHNQQRLAAGSSMQREGRSATEGSTQHGQTQQRAGSAMRGTHQPAGCSAPPAPPATPLTAGSPPARAAAPDHQRRTMAPLGGWLPLLQVLPLVPPLVPRLAQRARARGGAAPARRRQGTMSRSGCAATSGTGRASCIQHVATQQRRIRRACPGPHGSVCSRRRRGAGRPAPPRPAARRTCRSLQ